MKNRRERREEARANKTKFEPQYKSGVRHIPAHFETNEEGKEVLVEAKDITVGGVPRTYEEVFGVGNERFNNKFVTIVETETTTE
ncbi:hypothetical protein [Bacillus phage vB_BanS-Thrax3]|nr:hypothetical protein [Bacillus phage vB_BanS-Thrax3]